MSWKALLLVAALPCAPAVSIGEHKSVEVGGDGHLFPRFREEHEQGLRIVEQGGHAVTFTKVERVPCKVEGTLEYNGQDLGFTISTESTKLWRKADGKVVFKKEDLPGDTSTHTHLVLRDRGFVGTRAGSLAEGAVFLAVDDYPEFSGNVTHLAGILEQKRKRQSVMRSEGTTEGPDITSDVNDLMADKYGNAIVRLSVAMQAEDINAVKYECTGGVHILAGKYLKYGTSLDSATISRAAVAVGSLAEGADSQARSGSPYYNKCGNSCFGMCGPACSIWLVCGSRDCFKGCEYHDGWCSCDGLWTWNCISLNTGSGPLCGGCVGAAKSNNGNNAKR